MTGLTKRVTCRTKNAACYILWQHRSIRLVSYESHRLSVRVVTCISLCANDEYVIKWGRGETSTQCEGGLRNNISEGSMDTWIKSKLHFSLSQFSLGMLVFSMPWYNRIPEGKYIPTQNKQSPFLLIIKLSDQIRASWIVSCLASVVNIIGRSVVRFWEGERRGWTNNIMKNFTLKFHLNIRYWNNWFFSSVFN